MAYLYTLHRQQSSGVTFAELRAAVADLPFFHPQGSAGYICDIPQRRLWMEFRVEPDGTVTVHVPQSVFEQNTRMVNDLCHSLATQLRAAIYDHQLERDLDPNEPMSVVHTAAPDISGIAGAVLASPLSTLITILLTVALLALLTFVGILAFNIASVAMRR